MREAGTIWKENLSRRVHFFTITCQSHDLAKLHDSEIEFFPPIYSKFSVECKWNSKISPKRTKFGFITKKNWIFNKSRIFSKSQNRENMANALENAYNMVKFLKFAEENMFRRQNVFILLTGISYKVREEINRWWPAIYIKLRIVLAQICGGQEYFSKKNFLPKSIFNKEGRKFAVVNGRIVSYRQTFWVPTDFEQLSSCDLFCDFSFKGGFDLSAFYIYRGRFPFEGD